MEEEAGNTENCGVLETQPVAQVVLGGVRCILRIRVSWRGQNALVSLSFLAVWTQSCG